MGTEQHHAIIATTENDKERNRILRWIADLPPMYYRLFTSTEAIMNGFTTIVMTPDGSNDGTIYSDEGDWYRESFIAELKKADTEKEGTIHSPWHWVEVTYGEVGYGVTATNCVNDDEYTAPTPAQATDTALKFVADSLSHDDRDKVLSFAKFLKATADDFTGRITEANRYQLAMGAIPEAENERPPEQIVRGLCPECSEQLVSNLYWHPEHGYLMRYYCWEALMPNGRCKYYAVP